MEKQFKHLSKEELAKLSTEDLRAYHELNHKKSQEKIELVVRALNQGVLDKVETM